jgi:formylglycine-generating enzyme required for sulfatase activity
MGGEFAALGDRLDPEAVGVTSPPSADKGLQPLAPDTATGAQEALTETTFVDGYIDVFEKGFLPNPEDLSEVSQEVVESPEFVQQQVQVQQFAQQPISVEPPDPFAGWSLREWSFETVRVDRAGQIVERLTKTAKSHFVDLGEGVRLELVAIPGGQFQMGSPDEEEKRDSDERPVRTVTVPPLLVSRYPVTVKQWRRVAGSFPAVLNPKLNADPSRWKDAKGPVENVNWFDAMEFCARLSKATNRLYRLPSEAEWEYACRGGTQTPFAFGETLTPKLANYDGNYTYAVGPKGEYRERTTAVGQFPPNGFGLQDMHGNVWEWCLDDWHKNYQNAPVDSRPWFNNSKHEQVFMCQFQESRQMDNGAFQNLTDVDNKQSKLLRGGSWFYYPGRCRSAHRSRRRADNIDDNIGFRVFVWP